jgi:glycerol-1-phosphate dehydrogenase [NAD(P)+]
LAIERDPNALPPEPAGGFLFARYLSGFDREGRKRCSCGQLHELATREILMGDGVWAAIPERLRREHGEDKVVWVLSDQNTEAVAGVDLKRALRALRGLRLAEEVLPAGPKPECTPQLVERLAAQARAASAGLILSVGGGTMSDLGKSISIALGVPNWGLMTAPSMDAHTSGTANLKTPAGAVSRPAAASVRVFCDTVVLEKAPEELFLAGLGDQLAKFVGYLDWRLGAWLYDEAFCPEAAEASLESARVTMQALRDPGSTAGQVRLRLADALLTSGLCMQSLRQSRPAASSEHTAAHLWEIAHVARNPRLALHGLLVGAATALVYRVYREFFTLLKELPLDVASRVQELEREPSWDKTLDDEIQPFRAVLEAQTAGRTPVAQTCRESLSRFTAQRPRIQELADGLLGEVEEGLRLLGERGFPFDLTAYGLSPAEILLPFRYVRLLRNRTSAFDLMHLLGVERRVYRAALAAG